MILPLEAKYNLSSKKGLEEEMPPGLFLRKDILYASAEVLYNN